MIRTSIYEYSTSLGKKFPKNIVIQKWEEIANQVFENSEYILPICKFLENRVHDVFANYDLDT